MSADNGTTVINNFTFNITDYSVFGIMLSISIGIGIYFGFFAKGDDTTDEYLMGGKKMKTLPIAISLVASQLSGISIMTIPAEMYSFGVHYALNVAAMVLVIPILNYVIIPVFYNNNLSNCYEYLELRFNKGCRQVLTLAFVLILILMLPIFLFLPALAFAQVTGNNLHIINAVVNAVCVFYTMFGGIKAVVWTDVVQAGIMVFSVVLVGVLGAIKVGGLSEVLRIAGEGHRLDIDFSIDATTRTNFWNTSLSAIMLWTSYVGLHQSCVQRIVSLPSLKKARFSLTFFGAGFIIIMGFNCLTGIIMYARYHNCDPLTAGFVQKPDRMVPFFVQDTVGHFKGMPGVFISCVFSAALSTMSANLNSLSGVVYFDYIKPFIKHTEKRANFIMKVFILLAGTYSVFAGFIVEQFSSILQVIIMIGGISFGAVFGTFTMGMLMPKVHGRAAFWSIIISMVTMFIIVFGAHGRLHYETLPTTTAGCPANLTTTIKNVTTLTSLLHTNATTILPETVPTKSFNIFEISFNWYIVIGTLIVYVFGILLSYLLPPEKNSKLNPKLISPIIQPFINYELAQTEELPEMLTKTILKQ